MATPSAEPPVVVLEKILPRSPSRVFSAWTTPQALQQWWCATPDHQPTVAEVDLRIGGRYRLGMRTAAGVEHIVGGEYREIEPARKLAFTWRWEHSAEEVPVSLVTVLFLPHAAGCLLRLTHDGLLNAEQARTHGQGWTGCLAQLGRILVADADQPHSRP